MDVAFYLSSGWGSWDRRTSYFSMLNSYAQEGRGLCALVEKHGYTSSTPSDSEVGNDIYE